MKTKVRDYTEHCLCLDGKGDMVVVTRETREGEGLWVKCQLCGLVINKSGVPKMEIGDFYNKTYQDSNSFKEESKVTCRDHYELAFPSMKPVADYLLPKVDVSMRVLDIGASTGELLNQFKGKVGYLLGNEINEEFCRYMTEELGIESTSQDYFELEFVEKFDLIIINCTVDHMYNSLGVLEKVAQDLKPGGKLYIQTPNDEQALKKFLPEGKSEEFQKFMYQKAHYYSFTEATLRASLERVGFKVLDSFSRHDYSLKNFLHWYFTGSRQSNIVDAKIQRNFFEENSNFQKRMNELMREADIEFQKIISEEMAGELVCMFAEIKKEA